MLMRIVKMRFRPEEVENFLNLFDMHKSEIRNFPGCCGLDLLRDQDDKQVFFTYSLWQSSRSLQNYRSSEIFNEIWPKTKKMFSDKPEAWSVDKIVSLP